MPALIIEYQFKQNTIYLKRTYNAYDELCLKTCLSINTFHSQKYTETVFEISLFNLIYT